MNIENLCSELGASLPSLFECAKTQRAGIRITTPLMYPDGEIIEVHVIDHGTHYTVTDFGEALGWLRLQTTSLQRSPKQNRLIEDVCQTLGVRLDRGELTLQVKEISALGEAVTLVAQASLRVSDLWFTLCSCARSHTGRDQINSSASCAPPDALSDLQGNSE